MSISDIYGSMVDFDLYLPIFNDSWSLLIRGVFFTPINVKSVCFVINWCVKGHVQTELWWKLAFEYK